MGIERKNVWIQQHGDVTTHEEQLFYDSLPISMRQQCIRQKKVITRSHIYFLDFYFWKANLCVEIDGSVHDEAKRKAKDQKRDSVLQGMGIRTLRFRNWQITKPDSLKNIISYLEKTYF